MSDKIHITPQSIPSESEQNDSKKEIDLSGLQKEILQKACDKWLYD